MSLRLIKPGLAALGLPVHPTLIDPRTKLPLEALGVTSRGPIWPAMGGSGEDDDEDEKGKEGEGDTRDPQARIKALEEEKERHYQRAKLLEKEAADLRKFKEEKEREAMSEIDKAKGDASSASEKLTATEGRVRQLQIEKAFLLNNNIKWHNADQALRLADLSSVEVDTDGNVDTKALKAALVALARENKHLVKSDNSGDSDGKSGDDNSGEKDEKDEKDQQSGSSFAGKRKGEKPQPKTRDELAKRFPVLQQNR